MKRLAIIVATLSVVVALAGCATVGNESPAASPDLRDSRAVAARPTQLQSP